jgi:dTMP kinase
MKRGKIIVIEGTDCSGKATQSKMLLERLLAEGKPAQTMSFPNYDSPTGKIIEGPYLGKEGICRGWFPEGADKVNPKVASLYYAADRLYNLPEIEKIINSGTNLILDRYIESNMGHQGGKKKTKEEREKIYKFLNKLEYGLLELPRADLTLLLYMPHEIALELKKGREDLTDQHENNCEHLINAENAYLELAKKYHWKQINCSEGKDLQSLKTKEKIHEEIYQTVINKLL